MQNFPRPCSIGVRATRWRLSDIAAYEAARTGDKLPTIQPGAERYLSARAVAQRLGVAQSTVWRWSLEARRAGAREAAQ